MSFRNLIWYWLPPLLLSAVILAAASDSLSSNETAGWLSTLGAYLPPAALDLLNRAIRKSGHFVTYAVLGALFYRAVCSGRPGWSGRWAAIALALTLTIASADELRQSTTATREGSPWDVALDGSGACTALLLIRARARR